MSETYDMYDEFDCEVKERAKTVEVKEEEDSETDYDALENDDDQPAGDEAVVKTEEEDEFSIDMFDDEFHAIMEQEFFDNKNAIETNKAESVNKNFQTGSDATDIDEDDHSTVSEPQQNTEPVVSRSSSSASGEQQLNGRRKRDKIHKCQQCGKIFPWASNLKIHQVVHTGIREYQCNTCSKSFGLKNNLIKHQLVHTGIRAYKCSICTKSFSRPDILKLHQLVHTGIKTHQCTICSLTFGQKCNLTRHYRVAHNDSRPFQCSICEKTFKRKSHFKNHLQKVHHQ